MAPRGRRKKAGLMREDAARDAMRAFGFAEGVISVCIKELLELYGEGGWFLIEEFSYSVLLNKCLEKQGEQEEEMAVKEEEHEQAAQEEEEVKEQQEEQVDDGRDNVGSNSTSFVGCGAETGTQTCQTDALSITSETEIMDSSPAAFPSGEAPVVDYASPVAFRSSDYAHHSAGVAKSSGCGWLSDDEETEPDEDGVVVDDDDEMIQLTPEPLCEELKELLREVRGEKKRKRPTRWDT